MLKLDGQLNALILPQEDSQDFTWTAWDGLPTATALDGQEPSADPLNIRWGRSAVEVLERGEELSLCRHLETGRTLYILNQYLRTGPQGGVVRGLHRLSPARVPRGRIDPGGPDENRFFVQKRRGDGVVLWPPVRYNINPSNGGLAALHPLPGWAEQINIDRLL